ncbi:unnamed protein product [Protopolystoma xenopodis]|uniref:Uncharacterized protein n=1 Tax=Protopolystoma xenopodis TaxID=117903 RepID=A0A448WUK2_9PLAT|nr:unnamed protein product [Protopolystoma xenopodis]
MSYVFYYIVQYLFFLQETRQSLHLGKPDNSYSQASAVHLSRYSPSQPLLPRRQPFGTDFGSPDARIAIEASQPGFADVIVGGGGIAGGKQSELGGPSPQPSLAGYQAQRAVEVRATAGQPLSPTNQSPGPLRSRMACQKWPSVTRRNAFSELAESREVGRSESPFHRQGPAEMTGEIGNGFQCFTFLFEQFEQISIAK